MIQVLGWLVVPWHAAAAGLAGWWVWCRIWARRVNRRADLDVDLRLAWRVWHWFSGGTLVAWSPDDESRLGRRCPWLRLWTLESGRSLPCVDLPDVAELIEPGETLDDPDTGVPGPGRPWWGCRQRRVGVAAARTAGTVAVVLAEYVRAGAPTGTLPVDLLVWGVGGTAALAGVPVLVAYRAVRRAIFLHWEEPIAEAVRRRAGWWRPKDEPWVPVRNICRVYRDEQHGLRIWIAVDRAFEPGAADSKSGNRAQLWNDVATVAGIDVGKIEPDWSGLEGRHRSVTFRPVEQVPRKVLFNVGDKLVRETVEILEKKGSIEAPVLGLAAGRKPYRKLLATESPHLMISVGTGGGKSVFLKMVAAQMLWHGADLYILDYKQVSHRWVQGPHGLLNGVRAYCRSIPEIHAQAIELGRIAMARYEECKHLGADDDLPDYTPIVVAMDEIPQTLTMLRGWWASQPGNRNKPCESAIALEGILNMGRAVHVHIVGAWQRAEAKHMPGGSAARENFAVKVAVGANKETFDLMYKGAEFIAPNNRPGWAVAGHGFEVVEIQRILADDNRAGNMAVYRWVGHKRGYCQLHKSEARAEATSTPPSGPVLGDEPEYVTDSDPDAEVISFKQAVADGTCPYDNWDSAVRARRRARANGTWPDAAPGHEGTGEHRQGEKHYRQVLAVWYASAPSRQRRHPPDPLVYFLTVGGLAEVVAALRGDRGTGVHVKVGYTDQYLPDRIRPMTGYSVGSIVQVVRVPAPPRGQRLPDKWWHERFNDELMEPNRTDCETIRVTPGGPFARYLEAMLAGDEVDGPAGLVRGETWTPRREVAA